LQSSLLFWTLCITAVAQVISVAGITAVAGSLCLLAFPLLPRHTCCCRHLVVISIPDHFVADNPFLLAVLLIMSSLLLLTSHKVAAFTAVAGVLLLTKL
jgi:hypothetical protein